MYPMGVASSFKIIFRRSQKPAIETNPKYKINKERPSTYRSEADSLNFTNISFPTPISQIPRIESQNNLAIYVFGYTKKDGIYILHKSKRLEEPINLLLFNKDEKNHYCWIKNFSRLTGDINKHDGQKYWCFKCMTHFLTEEKLASHKEDCQGLNVPTCKVEMPVKGENILKFKNYKNKQDAPFAIYADFESVLEKLPLTDTNTVKTQIHRPCGYSYAVVRCDGVCTSRKTYRGQDAAVNFVESLSGRRK